MIDLAALEAELLALWRRTPAPRLAELLEQVSWRRPPGPPPDDWLAVAELGRDEDVPRLLLTALDDNWPARLAALAGRDDPRVVRAYFDLFCEENLVGGAPLLLSVLVAGRARHATSRLTEMAAGRRPVPPGARIVDVAAAADALRRLPAPPALSADEAVRAESIAARLASQRTRQEELLDAIAAAPDDDAPRLVYADWLIEQGDPRGEAIALHLAGGEPPVADGLLAAAACEVDFARGFPARVDLRGRRWPLARLVGHRALVGVESLTLPELADALAVALVDPLPLRALDGVRLSALAELVRERPRPYLRVGLADDDDWPSRPTTLAVFDRLPALTTLQVEVPYAGWIGPVCRSPLAHRVRRLRVVRLDDGHGNHGQRLEAFVGVASTSAFAELELVDEADPRTGLLFRRDAAGELRRV